MGENAVSELVVIVVEILVAALVIALISGYLTTSGSAVDKYNDEQNNLTIIENNIEFEQFNNTTVTGSDVIAAIYHFRNVTDTSLKRLIVSGGDYMDRSNELDPKDLYKESNSTFLTDKFTATVDYDGNGMVNLIRFTKK